MPTTINPSGQTITQFDALVGTASNLIANVGPGTAGQILQSAGNAANPAYSTTTYPTTNAINTLLYASAANVMSALATANSGVLATGATGVPSIDTTNFAVLSTGLQLKGNNTNTAPPAGFIGEQIRSGVTAVSITTTATPQNVTSITLSAGVWDISGLIDLVFSVAGGFIILAISTNTGSLTGTVKGDTQLVYTPTTSIIAEASLSIPAFRVTISSSTTYFLIASASFSSGTCTANGRISGTRVG